MQVRRWCREAIGTILEGEKAEWKRSNFDALHSSSASDVCVAAGLPEEGHRSLLVGDGTRRAGGVAVSWLAELAGGG